MINLLLQKKQQKVMLFHWRHTHQRVLTNELQPKIIYLYILYISKFLKNVHKIPLVFQV